MFMGKGRRPAKDVAHIEGLAGVTVVDKTQSKLLVVEANASIKRAMSALPDWAVGKETRFEVPKTRFL
ncbi:hypothetical protein [Burkholderia cenocepacia]|uniref:hypothetical protein n=1 Tax=Burkholderia cenocepacia TaxID=95486 RepID=UPI00076D0653|nr:hypothetical protein [Burkholderia cenocepacia]KWU23398.1 hypothetical protein AS149_37045 [Burkholderia cenocepacia]